MKNTIGLFGTCGNSTWRTAFINEYKAKGIPFLILNYQKVHGLLVVLKKRMII